jgi:guanylate kinase
MSLESNLQTLFANQQTYQPGEAAGQLLGEKELIMVVAPSSMGKSTVMNEVVKLRADFARVLNSTTRPQRPNDEPGLYNYVPHTEEGTQQIVDAIISKQLVQYAIFPTTGYIYFTKPDSYPATYNLLDTQSQVVQHMRSLPFRKTHVVGLVTDPATWQSWLSQRYTKDDPEFPKRIGEAINSLEWLLSQPDGTIDWVYNYPNDTTKSATELINIVTNQGESDAAYKRYAKELLKLALSLKK